MLDLLLGIKLPLRVPARRIKGVKHIRLLVRQTDIMHLGNERVAALENDVLHRPGVAKHLPFHFVLDSGRERHSAGL
jgi:hypothetical protein